MKRYDLTDIIFGASMLILSLSGGIALVTVIYLGLTQGCVQ
jgi:hypothetical protein